MPPLAEANPSTERQSGNAHSHAAAMRDGAIPHAHELLSTVDGDLVHQRDIDQEPAGGRVPRIGMSA